MDIAKELYIDLPKFSRKFTIKRGDIVLEEVDAIVNAANDRLQHNGGVAAAIHKASHGRVQEECKRLMTGNGSVLTGEAVATAARGNLKCKHVIHAVGPSFLHKNHCAHLYKECLYQCHD